MLSLYFRHKSHPYLTMFSKQMTLLYPEKTTNQQQSVENHNTF